MTYFDHRRPQQPYQQTFRQEPVTAYPVDEDGDRIYTEEDYGVPADGDAFLPDADDQDALLAEPAAPTGAPSPFSYAGAYDTMSDAPGDDWDEEPDVPYDDDMLTEEEREELRRNNWRLLANLADFGLVILGTAFILVLIALLFSLTNWLINDVSQTFTLLQTPM